RDLLGAAAPVAAEEAALAVVPALAAEVLPAKAEVVRVVVQALAEQRRRQVEGRDHLLLASEGVADDDLGRPRAGGHGQVPQLEGPRRGRLPAQDGGRARHVGGGGRGEWTGAHTGVGAQ